MILHLVVAVLLLAPEMVLMAEQQSIEENERHITSDHSVTPAIQLRRVDHVQCPIRFPGNPDG